MPQFDFDLHTWPGYPTPAIASAVRHAAESAVAPISAGHERAAQPSLVRLGTAPA
jgi:hypothetical protein